LKTLLQSILSRLNTAPKKYAQVAVVKQLSRVNAPAISFPFPFSCREKHDQSSPVPTLPPRRRPLQKNQPIFSWQYSQHPKKILSFPA
jgi:hypothetical protein